MKLVIAFALLTSVSAFSATKPSLVGKCAKQARAVVMESYGSAIEQGMFASVVSSRVSRNPSVYKVLVVAMDGSNEPFQVALDVRFEPNTCSNPAITYSK